jgi:WD40 repeat protein
VRKERFVSLILYCARESAQKLTILLFIKLFITDMNNIANPFRLGNTAARADDIECLDWNKKVAHILVTGTSGGFVTVWDVKTKKESLTLNNLGRKPVSAVAWDPDKVVSLRRNLLCDAY